MESIVETATSKPRPRHDLFVSRAADRVVAEMQIKGLALHLQYYWYGSRWWLSNGEHIDTEIAERVVADRRIVGVGDGLFPDRVRGQTWRYAPVWEGR
jgi:hypothetical protein